MCMDLSVGRCIYIAGHSLYVTLKQTAVVHVSELT